MIRLLPLPTHKTESTEKYSQNFVVGTTIVGSVYTVGRTKGLLVVIYRPVFGAGGGALKQLEPGVIQTKRIKLPGYDTRLTVDVLLIEYSGDINVKADLEKYKDQYDTIQVYLEKDVEFYD